MTKKIVLASAAFFVCVLCGAQSKSFRLGKWTEIQSSIRKELNRSYVDTLPIDRMEKAAVDKLLSELDPYTVYVPEEENKDFQMLINNTYGGVGAVIYKPEKDGYVVINEPYLGSPANKSGLECCDEIMEIDGKSVIGLDTKQCSDRMRGEPGTTVLFKVRKNRSGEVVEIKVVREKIHLPSVEYYGMIDDKTGYVLLTGFVETSSKEVREAIEDLKSKGMERFVLDLRGNGGGMLQQAVDIVSFFVPKGSVVVTAKGRAASFSYKTESDPIDTEIPVIVLVDSGSASASEIVSGALQDLDRATIMGHRTFGKGLVQSIRPLPYGGQLKVTTAKYYTPSGRCVQAIDYSNRNEDGSVGHIPDSLTHEFRTAGGRVVRDGGGVTPDVRLDSLKYSRLIYSLVAYGIVEQYALEFYRRHESIPPVDDFRFGDEDYEDFIEYAKGRKFDYRSSARTYYDAMLKELRKDGLENAMKDQLDALEKSLEMEKETFLRLKKDEIIPFIEEEIAVRYYFQQAGVKIRLRYDTQLRQALASPLITKP